MNISSNVSSTIFQQNSQSIGTSSERIASGQRINTAADDAAGLAIANRLNTQIRGYSQSIQNANDGVSLLQTADASLANLSENIQRIRELALQAANGTLTDSDRSFLNEEAQQLKNEITRNIETTQFNGKPLLSEGNSLSLQVGPQEGEQIDVGLSQFDEILETLDFDSLDLSTSTGAREALGSLDTLQESINENASTIGASLNRVESTINTLTTNEINAEASRSRIADADFAKEISELTASRVKEDVSIAIQAQANADRGSVLRLLNVSD